MTTTATIEPGLSFSRGDTWCISIETDRKPLARGGLGRGKKAGTMVGDSLPGLLRTTAEFMEQEGIEDLDGLAAVLATAKGAT